MMCGPTGFLGTMHVAFRMVGAKDRKRKGSVCDEQYQHQQQALYKR